MTPKIKTEILAQLKQIIEAYNIIKVASTRVGNAANGDWSHFNSKETEVAKLTARSLAAAERIAGRNSAYTRQIESIINSRAGYEGQKLDKIIGVVQSLSEDIDADAIDSIEELVHGELFGDFLEMASHLLDEGYKDAAAVIAGSSLEAHLRQLCNKNGIDTERHLSDGSSQPKKADSLNSELTSNSVYNGLIQKSITAWLGLRNKAAHGEYDQYVKEQVGLMVDGIRDFITRNPA